MISTLPNAAELRDTKPELESRAAKSKLMLSFVHHTVSLFFSALETPWDCKSRHSSRWEFHLPVSSYSLQTDGVGNQHWP